MNLQELTKKVDETFGKYGGENDLATTTDRKKIEAHLLRLAGWTYQRIGDAIGMTPQGAMRRAQEGGQLVSLHVER